jgi:predicted Zn-dependent peptidase
VIVKFQRTQLPNDLEIIGEVNPDARSVAVGFFVRTGARDETPDVHGVSHFLEHMVFKGSERRSALDVNREFDEIGARYNAFTSEENTVFWGAVLPEYLPRLVDLLADMLRPSLRGDDFDMEKKVILEEIGMYQDQPMWVAYEAMMREHFGPHPLGRSVLGTTESVGGLARDQMKDYFDRRYVTNNMLVAVAGNVDWPKFCDIVAEPCASWSRAEATRDVRPASGSGSVHVITQKKIQQEHVLLVSSAPPAESTDRFAADVLATAVGDGTGSRLFWELVDPGLAETAELDYHEFNAAGTFMTYLCCEPDNVRANLDRVLAMYRRINVENIGEHELDQVKNKAAARIVLRSERPMGRLMPLGFNWVYRREYRHIDDDLAALQAVTLDDLARVLGAHPLDRVTTVAVGPMSDEEFRQPADANSPA